MQKLLGPLCVLFIWSSTALVSAEVPQLIHYQGYLTNGAGEAIDCPDPFSCGEAFEIKFRLYDVESGGVVQWEEIHTSMAIYGGSFGAVLGSVDSISPSTLAGPVWLGVSVNSHPEMSPRQRLVSAAYAIRAETSENSLEAVNAAQLGGVDAAEYVPGPKFSGQFVDLEGVPSGLADGDDDSQLTEAQVDEMVANNGFASQTDLDNLSVSLAPIAHSGDWADLQNIPEGLNDGDQDTQLSEAEVDAMVDNNGFASQSDLEALSLGLAPIATSGDWAHLQNIPAGLDDGDQDSLGELSCAPDEVAQWDGASWICAAGTIPKTNAPNPCEAESAGAVYYDTETGRLMLCDGSSYLAVRVCSDTCPDPSTIPCATQVLDDCGTPCGAVGTALNAVLCQPSAVACGQAVVDTCGNDCGLTGNSLNTTQCGTGESTPCGNPVLDDCGNACGITGTGLNTIQCGDAALVPCSQDVPDSCGNPCGYPGTDSSTCNDDNLCTDDTCPTGSCEFVANTLPCNDGQACTSGDVCGGGVCSGTPDSVNVTASDLGVTTMLSCSGGGDGFNFVCNHMGYGAHNGDHPEGDFVSGSPCWAVGEADGHTNTSYGSCGSGCTHYAYIGCNVCP